MIQTTPYIGHPAYKAMGGGRLICWRPALFVGTAGLFGYFGYLYVYIPKPTVFPILIFVGLEITAQSFRATPKRHYPAVALACVPALAALAMIYVDKLVPPGANSSARRWKQRSARSASSPTASSSPACSGRRAWRHHRPQAVLGSGVLFVAALCTTFGIIHSPAPGSPLFVPWETGEITDKMQPFFGFYPSAHFQVVVPYVAGYRRGILPHFLGRIRPARPPSAASKR